VRIVVMCVKRHRLRVTLSRLILCCYDTISVTAESEHASQTMKCLHRYFATMYHLVMIEVDQTCRPEQDPRRKLRVLANFLNAGYEIFAKIRSAPRRCLGKVYKLTNAQPWPRERTHMSPDKDRARPDCRVHPLASV
jgi:hypothetical protein